jgi:hypothetical protein
MEKKSIGVTIAAIVEKNINKLKLFEKISLAIFTIGFILVVLKQPNTGIVLIIGSIMTALTYFLYAYVVVETEDLETTGILNSLGMINFLYKLMYFSLSISALAMLGLVVHFKKTNSLMVLGGSTLLVILILSLITKIKDRSVIYNKLFYIRIVTCLLLLAYLKFYAIIS